MKTSFKIQSLHSYTQHWQASSDLQRSMKYSTWCGVAHKPCCPVNPLNDQRNKQCILSLIDIWVLLGCTTWDVTERVLNPDSKKNLKYLQKVLRWALWNSGHFWKLRPLYMFSPSCKRTQQSGSWAAKCRKYQDIFNVSPLHVSPVRHVETWNKR